MSWNAGEFESFHLRSVQLRNVALSKCIIYIRFNAFLKYVLRNSLQKRYS
jgi:hypothetical protein